MNPQEVRFTQDSIRFIFADGRTIDDLANDLRSGRIQAEDIPALRLFVKDGKYYCLDNRRLEAFRRAAIPIPFRMASAEEVARESWKFTTRNDGISVRLRGENRGQ